MRVKFVTFGCKVNQYETQALKEDFLRHGFMVTSENCAELYVVNSCSVTGKADRKVHEAVKKIKNTNPQAKIALTGCLAQLDSERVKKWGVDWIVAQDDKMNLVEIVRREGSGDRSLQDQSPATDKGIDRWRLGVTEFVNHRAFVKVQDGCDNACTFCKIHHIRGKSVSRPMADILREIEILSEKFHEVVICGVNLAMYGRDFAAKGDASFSGDLRSKRSVPISLAALVENILAIKNLGRLRLSSLESLFAGEDILQFLNHPKFCPHLHIPFQSGDDNVLKAMGKHERVKDYLAFVDKARAINPDVAISADFIVGFPAEDETAFKNTVEFMDKVRPMRTHTFTFSPRESTIYKDFKVKDKGVIKERYTQMCARADELAREYAAKFIGRKFEVICEDPVGGVKYGYTPNYLHLPLAKDVVPGSVITVTMSA